MALVRHFYTTGMRDPRQRLVHRTRARQDGHIGPRLMQDGLSLHVGGSCPKGWQNIRWRHSMYLLCDILVNGAHQAPNTDVAWSDTRCPGPRCPHRCGCRQKTSSAFRGGTSTALEQLGGVEVAAGQSLPRGVPQGATQLLTTAVPHYPHMALHTVDGQSEGGGPWFCISPESLRGSTRIKFGAPVVSKQALPGLTSGSTTTRHNSARSPDTTRQGKTH